MNIHSPQVYLIQFITVLCFAFFPFSLSAQFAHRVQVHGGISYSKFSEQIDINKGYIRSVENAEKTGYGYSFGLTYMFKEIPISFSLGNINEEYSIVFYYPSDVIVENDNNHLYKNTLEFNIEYSVLKRSTLIPVIFVGLNYNSLNLVREDISYHFQDYAWGYEEVDVQLGAWGFSGGLMLKLRMSDKIGLYYRGSVGIVNQDYTDWLNSNNIFYSNYFGIYLRLLKRKTI